jgi:putative ABC transport system substrate-binding protein
LVAATLRHARAQQPAKVHRIAIIAAAAPVTEITETSSLRLYRALFQELRRLGYVEGRNLIVERYSGEGRTEHYAEVARVVVTSKPDLILAPINIPGVQDLKAATATIPIVAITADPVGFGLVASLAHPGGNITGFSVDAGPEIATKHLELLKEAFPRASRVGVLGRRLPGPYGKPLQEAAHSLGILLLGPRLEGTLQEAEYRRVFEAMAQEHADALYVSAEPENLANRRLIVELAEKNRLPTIYPYREYVEIGGLMAYAVDLVDLFTRAAGYIDQILKGVSPGDIPVAQPAKFEFVLNLKTAKALGLTVPPSLLIRADEVIE